MITISLCMIVKNEEQTLPRCLECVKDVVDEIIIVDTGSTDKTKQIAAEFTSKIYDFEWIDDFSAARNYSFSKVTMDYIFWLDADDVVLADDAIKLKQLKQTLNPKVDIVMMKYNTLVSLNNDSICSFYRERLLKNSKNYRWNDPVHEYIELEGEVINTDITITHRKMKKQEDRNIKIFEKMIEEGKQLSDRNIFYYATELFHNRRFGEAIIYYKKFLDTTGYLLSNYIDSCIELAQCYFLKNEEEEALMALYKSFEYDVPRAEVCCQLGYYFKKQEDYKKAIFWFELAMRLKKPDNTWGTINHDCWDYIPYIELCACYYSVGCITEAIHFNDMALKCKPDSILALENKRMLENARLQKMQM